MRHACRRHCIIAAGLLRELNYWFEIYISWTICLGSRRLEPIFFQRTNAITSVLGPFDFALCLVNCLQKCPCSINPSCKIALINEISRRFSFRESMPVFINSCNSCPDLVAFLAKQSPFWLTAPYTKRSKSPTQELPSKLLHLIPSRLLSAFLAIAE